MTSTIISIPIAILIILLIIVIYIVGIIVAFKYFPDFFNNDNFPPPPGLH